ncbi:hypothetical protein BDA99DRAFT_561353 [Phascolomyces articulosus]|uniref:Uncharacterized protein n=1 Tax=Phascolomyces articulosus TaxID=60185 RepID=A0AAD5PCV0_9FUNG|nr:hypothetical protein BDA99DRAFT_561353 [Phascolomyces articulosus]
MDYATTNNNILSGMIYIQNSSRPFAFDRHQPKIRLLGQINMMDETTTTFLDQTYYLIIPIHNSNKNTDNINKKSTLTSLLSSNSVLTSTKHNDTINSMPENINNDENTIFLPFSIPLNKNIPSSFSTLTRAIRYTLYVSIWTTTQKNESATTLSIYKKNDDPNSKDDVPTKIFAIRPVFIHRRQDYFPTATTIITNRLYWGTSKQSRLWRYEIQLPRVVTLKDLIAPSTSSCIHSNNNSTLIMDDHDTTSTTPIGNKYDDCYLNIILRIKNTQHHFPRRRKQQQLPHLIYETSTALSKQFKKYTECCIAEFKFVEECTLSTNSIHPFTSSSKSCLHSTEKRNASSSSIVATTLLSETHILSWPSFTWNEPFKASFKLDRFPLPTTTTTPTTSISSTITTESPSYCHDVQIRHYLNIKLTFDDGNEFIDYNTHTFPIEVIPLLLMKKNQTKVSSFAPSSRNDNKKLYRDASFNSATSSATTLNNCSKISTNTSSNSNSDIDIDAISCSNSSNNNNDNSDTGTCCHDSYYSSSSDESFTYKKHN